MFLLLLVEKEANSFVVSWRLQSGRSSKWPTCHSSRLFHLTARFWRVMDNSAFLVELDRHSLSPRPPNLQLTPVQLLAHKPPKWSPFSFSKHEIWTAPYSKDLYVFHFQHWDITNISDRLREFLLLLTGRSPSLSLQCSTPSSAASFIPLPLLQ